MIPESREDGQVLVFVVGLAVVVFSVGGLTVDGTRAFIARRSLQNAADAAATAGAAAIDEQQYYRTGGTRIVTDEADAREEVMSLLRLRNLDARPSISISAREVQVALSETTDTTFLRLIGVDRIPIGVVATARAFALAPDGR